MNISYSYGKDSGALIEICFRHNLPVDQIVTADIYFDNETTSDLPPEKEFKERADEIIKKRYGIAVTHVRSKKTYTDMVLQFGHFPYVLNSYCKALKIRPLNKLGNSYIGYAADEVNTKRLDIALSNPDRYPLIKYGITEEAARSIVKDIGLLSPRYETDSRDGCFFCHCCTVDYYRNLRNNYPDYWRKLLDLNSQLDSMFTREWTVQGLDYRFQYEQQHPNLTGRKFFKELKSAMLQTQEPLLCKCVAEQNLINKQREKRREQEMITKQCKVVKVIVKYYNRATKIVEESPLLNIPYIGDYNAAIQAQLNPDMIIVDLDIKEVRDAKARMTNETFLAHADKLDVGEPTFLEAAE